MFGELSYLGYTALFCLPPLVLIWLRREFYQVLAANLRRIVVATVALTAYGCAIWPVALRFGAWSYGADRIIGVQLFGVLFLEDLVWWVLISLLFASFVVLATHYEDQGVDIVEREITSLLVSFRDAFAGLRSITLERNATIHVAAATFVVLEAMLFRLTITEWALVAIVVASVLGLEVLNSSIERVASTLSSEPDENVRLIKDSAAAGVLIAAAGSAAVGVMIFLPRLIAALK